MEKLLILVIFSSFLLNLTYSILYYLRYNTDQAINFDILVKRFEGETITYTDNLKLIREENKELILKLHSYKKELEAYRNT